MKFFGVALLFSLLAGPAVAQDAGTVTFLEGSLRIIRGTAVLQAAEGSRVRQGDILESSEKGFAQMEFTDGAIAAIGPSSRMYIFRHRAGGSPGGSAAGEEFVLLSGWLKAESDAKAGTCRYESPLLAATTKNGAIVLHTDESESDVFIESGSAAVAEVASEGMVGKPAAGNAGQFFSRHRGKAVVSSSRPTSAFLDGLPRPFRDALPPRLSHFKGKPVEPKVQHPVSYAEIQPWLTIPSAWRKGFVDRFQSRLADPEFRKQLEAHAAEYPEWATVLHPQSQ